MNIPDKPYEEMTPQERSIVQDELASWALGEKFAPARPWYRPNLGQAIFGWIAGISSLLAAMVVAQDYDGKPLGPALAGIVLIAWALGYERSNSAARSSKP